MRRISLALPVLLLAGSLVVPISGAEAIGARTSEAVAVWQHRDANSPTGWDVWYSALGRTNVFDPPSTLAWHATGGPVAQAAPIARIAGDDKNPHVSTRNNVTFAVWQHAPGTGASPGDYDIFFSRFNPATGVWTAPAAIATLAGSDFDPNIAVDSGGNAVAVWVHRNATGTREMYSSVFSGTWSAPAPIGASGGQASLPEVSLVSVSAVGGALSNRAVAAWSDVPPGLATHRMYYSVFNGLTWSAPGQIEAPGPIPLSINNVGFANYSGTEPDPFGAFGRLGVTGDGLGNAFVIWGGGPTILGFFSPGIVGAFLNVATNTWTAMTTPFGGRFIGVGGCENPDDALTTGLGDFLGIFSFAGFLEHTRRVSGGFTSETFSYNHVLNDQRPSNAAVSATDMISVNWGAPMGPGSEIIWSRAALTPSATSWVPAANLVPGGLAGEDMFPEMSSGFNPTLVSADAYTVDLRIDGVPTPPGPVRIRTLADARIDGPGSDADQVEIVTLPMGLGEIVVGRNESTGAVNLTATPPRQTSGASATIERATLLGGMIQAEALRAQSGGSRIGAGAPSTTDAGSHIARLEVAGNPVLVPATGLVVPLPGGIGTLSVFEQVTAGGPGHAEREVRALHLQVSVAGHDIDLIVASAYAGVSTGPILSARRDTTPTFEPPLPTVP